MWFLAKWVDFGFKLLSSQAQIFDRCSKTLQSTKYIVLLKTSSSSTFLYGPLTAEALGWPLSCFTYWLRIHPWSEKRVTSFTTVRCTRVQAWNLENKKHPPLTRSLLEVIRMNKNPFPGLSTSFLLPPYDRQPPKGAFLDHEKVTPDLPDFFST